MKTIRVRELTAEVGAAPRQAVILHQDTSLAETIRTLATGHSLRGVFLIDDLGRLAGVINRHDLLNWCRLQLHLPWQAHPLPVSQVRRLVMAAHARDLAIPDSAAAAVHLDDTLADALEKMARFDLEDIPVIDDQGRVVDDVRLSQVLAYVVQ